MRSIKMRAATNIRPMDRPRCDCHGLPQYRNGIETRADGSTVQGWRCRVKQHSRKQVDYHRKISAGLCSRCSTIDHPVEAVEGRRRCASCLAAGAVEARARYVPASRGEPLPVGDSGAGGSRRGGESRLREVGAHDAGL